MKRSISISILVILIIGIIIYNRLSYKESFENTEEDQYLESQEKYYEGRVEGPSFPEQTDADKFYTFDSSKEPGKQLVMTDPVVKQPTSGVDVNVKRCKQVTSCDELNNTNCGYCFYNNEFYYGNESGPYTDVCPGGWVKTKEGCEERRERAVCDKVTNCNEMVGEAAVCGWCPTNNKAMVSKTVNDKLEPKYPTKDKCDNSVYGLVGQADCGTFGQEHPCLGPKQDTGPHSLACLNKLWKQSGCTKKGTIGPTSPNNNNTWWNQRSWQAILTDMKAWYNLSVGTNWTEAESHHKGCLGTDADSCNPKYSPRPLECAQKLFLASGCVEKGKLYPSIENVAKYGPDYYNTADWTSGIKNWNSETLTQNLTKLMQDTHSSEYKVKARATELCLGTQIVAPPPLKAGDVVKYTVNVGAAKTAVCANDVEHATITFQGYICKINSDNTADVLWQSMANANPSSPSLNKKPTIHWVNTCNQCPDVGSLCKSGWITLRQPLSDTYNVGESVKKWGCHNVTSNSQIARAQFAIPGANDNGETVPSGGVYVIEPPRIQSPCPPKWQRVRRDPKWIATYLGACGKAPTYFQDSVKAAIPVNNLVLVSSCKVDTNCPDAGCAMQLILAVSYAPNLGYNVTKSQVTNILVYIRQQYPGAVLCQMTDIQYLVDIGIPYCFCGWVLHNQALTSAYPSIQGTNSGCGGGQQKVISCGDSGPSWTGGKAGVYIRVTGDPSNVINKLKATGKIVGDIVAVVGKNEYTSLL